MGFCAWISTLFGRSVAANHTPIAADKTSIKGNKYEVFTRALHHLYYVVLSGTHPGAILMEIKARLSTYEFPMIRPTFTDQCLFATFRMLQNLEKKGWMDRFLTFDQYNLLSDMHPERLRYANDLYRAFQDFSVFIDAIMDPEMATAMEESRMKKNERYERRLRVVAARQDAHAQKMFEHNIKVLGEMEEDKLNNPPPAYSPAIPGPPPVHGPHAIPVSGPGHYPIRPFPQGLPDPPAYQLPRLPGRLPRYPGPNSAQQSDLPDPLAFPYDEYGREAAYRELAELEERERREAQFNPYARAVNTGRNSRNRPRRINLGLLPQQTPASEVEEEELRELYNV